MNTFLTITLCAIIVSIIRGLHDSKDTYFAYPIRWYERVWHTTLSVTLATSLLHYTVYGIHYVNQHNLSFVASCMSMTTLISAVFGLLMFFDSVTSISVSTRNVRNLPYRL